MYIIVGLGNPGRQYAETRHNMGFMALERLSRRWNIPLAAKGFQGHYGKGIVKGEKVLLVAPQTYMNASGECVGAMVRYFGVPTDHVLVIYDDIDLPVGRLRLRKSGSAGTHNGMKSLLAHLGTENFPRLRVGVGAPGPGVSMVDYVLGVPRAEERKVLALALDAALDTVEEIIADQMEAAMQYANRFEAVREQEG